MEGEGATLWGRMKVGFSDTGAMVWFSSRTVLIIETESSVVNCKSYRWQNQNNKNRQIFWEHWLWRKDYFRLGTGGRSVIHRILLSLLLLVLLLLLLLIFGMMRFEDIFLKWEECNCVNLITYWRERIDNSSGREDSQKDTDWGILFSERKRCSSAVAGGWTPNQWVLQLKKKKRHCYPNKWFWNQF